LDSIIIKTLQKFKFKIKQYNIAIVIILYYKFNLIDMKKGVEQANVNGKHINEGLG